jgi:hypothetical protein
MGIVGRIGTNVKGLNTRDRVIFISHSAFSTQVVVSENICEKIPDDLSFDDAATMPCVFATSYYSIFNVGNLMKGQVSLISSTPEINLTILVYTRSQCLWWCWYFRNPAGSDGGCDYICNS